MRELLSTTVLLAGIALIASPALAQDAPAAPAEAPAAVTSPPAAKVDAGQNAAEPVKADVPAAEAPAGPPAPFTVAFGVAGVSDYRFRGISLSNKKVAVQPSLTLTHRSGFHVGTWISNITPNAGDDLEVDLIGGWGGALGPITVDVSATDYVYPGTHGINYVEFIGTASHAFGNLTLGTTLAYTPRQGTAAPSRGLYGAVNIAYAIPKTPLTLTGSIGLEDNAFYSNKRDYSVGISAVVAGFTVGGAYVKAGHTGGDPNGKGRLVFSISRTFSTDIR